MQLKKMLVGGAAASLAVLTFAASSAMALQPVDTTGSSSSITAHAASSILDGTIDCDVTLDANIVGTAGGVELLNPITVAPGASGGLCGGYITAEAFGSPASGKICVDTSGPTDVYTVTVPVTVYAPYPNVAAQGNVTGVLDPIPQTITFTGATIGATTHTLDGVYNLTSGSVSVAPAAGTC